MDGLCIRFCVQCTGYVYLHTLWANPSHYVSPCRCLRWSSLVQLSLIWMVTKSDNVDQCAQFVIKLDGDGLDWPCLDSPVFVLPFIYPKNKSANQGAPVAKQISFDFSFKKDRKVPATCHCTWGILEFEITWNHCRTCRPGVVPSRAALSFPFAYFDRIFSCFEVAFPGYLAERLGSMARDTKTAGMPSPIGWDEVLRLRDHSEYPTRIDLCKFNDAAKLLAIRIK